MTAQGLVGPNAGALASAAVPEHPGTGSALLGFLQWVLAGAIAPLAGLGGEHTAVPMAAIVLALTAASAVAYLAAGIRRTTNPLRPPPHPRPQSAAAEPGHSHSSNTERTRKEPFMRGVMTYGPGDVRVVDRDEPRIVDPTDAVIRLTATCICGSDLWPYRGAKPAEGLPMGHEYVGIVEEVGSAVETVKPGDFVVGSFVISDGTCEICRAGYPSRCVNAAFVHGTIGTQSERARIPYADGTLVATPGMPSDDLVSSLLAASDVLGTGWFAAVAAEAGPGKTVAVVGDGAVGLLGVLAARELGSERIIAMSRHTDRQALAHEFGATDIVEERGADGVARVKELTDGLGAHSVIEAVGTQESMMQAIRSTRPGGHVGFVGVSHDVALPGDELFFSQVHPHGGPAPVRRFLPDLIDRIWATAASFSYAAAVSMSR
jgi:threonine dehydrogenase-like Zn-dependent dehydrogenase